MSKKYVVITKVGNDDFKKWNVNNLLLFTKFLDSQHSNWRWFNVFDKKTAIQLTSFTRHRRPVSSYI